MRSSIRQVAARANVSPMTVSHALNGRRGAMSEETYERVMQAVRDLNYVPVRTAAQNRHVETRAIGLVPYHANVSHTVLDNFTQGGIYEGARKHGYDVLVMLRDEADWMVNRKDVRFLDRRSDGFIFVSGGIGEWQHALELLVEHEIPTVVCYRRDVPPQVGWVDPDNEAIVHQALDCLWSHGHRRVAFLGSPDTFPIQASTDPNWIVSAMAPHSSFDDVARRRTFLADGKRHPWEHLAVITGADPTWVVLPETLDQIRSQNVTGILCASDFLALQFMDLALGAGWKIPRDLSVVGIDDFPEAQARGLTSLAFGYSVVGRTAVDVWLKLRQGESAAACSVVLPVQLKERTSVARPRTGKNKNKAAQPGKTGGCTSGDLATGGPRGKEP